LETVNLKIIKMTIIIMMMMIIIIIIIIIAFVCEYVD
jgi:hypothetical protein